MFRGYILNVFSPNCVVQVTSERGGDPEFSETRLAVPSNQDVALDVPGISVWAHLPTSLAYRSDTTV